MYKEKRNQFYSQQQKPSPTFTRTYISFPSDLIQEIALKQHQAQSDKQN